MTFESREPCAGDHTVSKSQNVAERVDGYAVL
ncbi:hypothetical protein C8K44_10565 [Aminobacter sp. AP02]|nr:hypothetical protein C8K44_10565 [Aminobacter sp. AP02]